MALDAAAQATLGIMAGTLAHWMRDNQDRMEKPAIEGEGTIDAEELGMYAMATGFLRMYYELYRLGEIQDPQAPPPPPTHDNPGTVQ